MKRLLIISFALMICLSGCGKLEKTKEKRTQEGLQNITEGVQKEEAESITDENMIYQPDYPVYDDAQSLVDASDSVFSGVVKKISFEEIDISQADSELKMPYTVYEVQVKKIYQGKEMESIIKVKHLQSGAGSDDDLNLAIGESYLFLVEVYEDEETYPSLLNAEQSVYEMDNKTSNDAGTYSLRSTVESQEISLQEILSIIEK